MRKITPQEQDTGFRLNLGEYARILWRKKYFLLVPLAISAAVSNVGVRFLVPEYESSSVIRIGSSSSVSTEVDRYVLRSHDEELAAQLEADIMGSAFLDELIHELGLDQDPNLIDIANYERENLYPGVTTEELVMRRLRNFLKKRIGIHREGPSMYRLAYADPNPEACYVVAQALTRLYIDRQQRQTMGVLKNVSEFSEEQLSVYKERLDRSERELANFQELMASKSTAANPVTQGNVGLAERVRSDLDLTINGAEATIDKIRARVVSLLGSVPDGDVVWKDPEVHKLENELTSRRESELLGELSASPTGAPAGASEGIVTTQQAIQRRLGQLVAARFSRVPADYQPLVVEYFYQQAEINAFRTKRSRLDAYIGSFRTEVSQAPKMDTELARLRQDVENNRSVYNTFRDARQQTQISEAVTQNTELGASVTLVETANKPLAPVRPNRIKILALAVFLGLALGAAALLLTEFTDSSFRSVDEIEKQLGLKVLGTIPRFEKARWFHDSSRKRLIIWSATSVVLLSVALSGFYLYGKSSREQIIDLNFTRATTTNPASAH